MSGVENDGRWLVLDGLSQLCFESLGTFALDCLRFSPIAWKTALTLSRCPWVCSRCCSSPRFNSALLTAPAAASSIPRMMVSALRISHSSWINKSIAFSIVFAIVWLYSPCVAVNCLCRKSATHTGVASCVPRISTKWESHRKTVAFHLCWVFTAPPPGRAAARRVQRSAGLLSGSDDLISRLINPLPPFHERYRLSRRECLCRHVFCC